MGAINTDELHIMTLAIVAAVALPGFWLLSKFRFVRAAASAPALMLAAGAAISFAAAGAGVTGMPAEWTSALAETGLAALVFVSAAQLRVSRFASRCPISFRLTIGGAPLFMIVCALAAFIMLPQLSAPSALLLGAALMLNGSAFDRRAVTEAPAPGVVKAAVRTESAAILALGAPVALLIAGFAVAAGPEEPAAAPLFAASVAALYGFTIGGFAGYLAGALERRGVVGGARASVTAALVSFFAAALIGADPIIAAGAAGLLWGEQTPSPQVTRLRLRQSAEQAIAPVAYLAFALVFAPRLFQTDLLILLFAAAAVTIMRAGPRLAALQTSFLPRESQGFLAWFGGAPGAASALFVLSLLDESMIVDHEALLTIAALSVAAGVFAARVTSRPLTNTFLRQMANAKRQRLYA